MSVRRTGGQPRRHPLIDMLPASSTNGRQRRAGQVVMAWWTLALVLGTTVAEISTLDLDAEEPEQRQPAETAQKSELENVRKMTSDFWEQLPPGVKHTAIWDYGFDGVVGAHAV